MLTISKITQRRFILGKQGLYPGRRWQGKDGVLQAIRLGCVVQVDPLNVVARSHDLVLYGRVLDYQPADLEALLYRDRLLFDYGGAVFIYPMEELPYHRVTMRRKAQEPRRVAFVSAHAQVIDQVRSAIRERGPLGTSDLPGKMISTRNYRSNKDTAQALYHLWLAGELMTHSRRGFQRIYDLTERVAPSHLLHVAAVDEAEKFFALRTFQYINLTTLRGWRGWFAGSIERRVEPAEASEWIEALLASGKIVQVSLEDDPKTPRYLLADDFPLLEMVHSGKIPEEWQPLETTTQNEVTLLAPLEIVSARGRALPLFDFEYLWEVYKPVEQRRWGYYTLPILYGDRLVARLDPRLDRVRHKLEVKGYWQEAGFSADGSYLSALTAGLSRFKAFTGAESIDLPASLRIE